MFRDPRYLLPLAVLLGVILVAAVAVWQQRTATGTTAPDGPDPTVIEDYVRSIDLRALHAAALRFATERGGLPATANGPEPVCLTDDNAGCALREVAPDLAATDGRAPYWYQSDGATYFIFIARANGEYDRRDCPDVLPPSLASGPVMCVRGGP